tara:strand:+ start:15 stop:308 length:294 start_codon:yes stop_codon:yes gene_type:complete
MKTVTFKGEDKHIDGIIRENRFRVLYRGISIVEGDDDGLDSSVQLVNDKLKLDIEELKAQIEADKLAKAEQDTTKKEEEGAKRVRRTKAQIEADNQK